MRMERGGVSWDRSKCGEQAGKWVSTGEMLFKMKKWGWAPPNRKPK